MKLQSKFSSSSSSRIVSCAGCTSHLRPPQQQNERDKEKSRKHDRCTPSFSNFLTPTGVVGNCKPEDNLSFCSSSPSSSVSSKIINDNHDEGEETDEEQWTKKVLVPPAASPLSTPHNHLHQRRVTFDRVEVVELSVELGDHPCCRRGPALRMSGRVQRQLSMPIKDYEEERSPKRRPQTKLYLSSKARMKILSEDNNNNDHAPRNSIERKSRRNDHWLLDPERRIMQIDMIMRDLFVRMDALDNSLARQRKQQQNRDRPRQLLQEEEQQLAQQQGRLTVGTS